MCVFRAHGNIPINRFFGWTQIPSHTRARQRLFFRLLIRRAELLVRAGSMCLPAVDEAFPPRRFGTWSTVKQHRSTRRIMKSAIRRIGRTWPVRPMFRTFCGKCAFTAQRACLAGLRAAGL